MRHSNPRLLSILASCALVVVGVTALASPPAGKKLVATKFALDKPVKDFKLKDLFFEPKEEDKKATGLIALSQFKDKKNVILFFMSEYCGTTRLYDARIGKLLKDNADKDVAMLGVRCSANDTPEGLRKWVEAKNFDIPLLNDEKGALSSYFKIVRTPSFALIDKKGTVRYFGSFDDSGDDTAVKESYLPDALAAVMSDGSVKTKRTEPFG